MFFITRADGVIDCWDLLLQQDEPILSINVSQDKIQSIKPHQDGKHIVVGNVKGSTYLIELAENMREYNKNEKAFLKAVNIPYCFC